MAGATRQIEVKVEPGSEGVIRLVAVPPVKLTLKVVKFKQDGRKYQVKLEGTHENLAPPGNAVNEADVPTCCVAFKTNTYRLDRPHKVDGVRLQIKGNSCTAELEVDVFEAGLFGSGQTVMSVTPDFPFAPEFEVSGTAVFDNPLNVEGVGVEPEKQPSPAKPAPSAKGKGAAPKKEALPGLSVLLGKSLELEPVFSKAFEKSTLRLSVFEEGAIKARRAKPANALTTFEWTDENDDERIWRVGYAESDDAILLTYLETRQESYGYDLRLEVIDENGKSFLVWERARGISFPRPKLKSFRVGSFGVEAEVENLEPGFKLPLELSLWTYSPLAPDSPVQVMDLYEGAADAESSSSEFFLGLLTNNAPSVLVRKRKIFSLLRIPKTLSGTEDYVPVSAVMDYDDKFLTFDEDQLWLEPPKKGKKPVARPKRTPKELATAVASEELDPTMILTRTPHFGDVSAGVRGNDLRLSFRLVGDIQYWKDAAPVFSLYDEKGETELVKLKATPTEANPHVHEALVPLSDKRFLGKKVSVRAVLGKPETKLWNQPVEAPVMIPRSYECVPQFGPLKRELIELTDETTYIKLQCHANHIPNGKEGTVLAFRVCERVAELAEPILMSSVKLRYAHEKGAGGLCDANGWLVARVTDKASVEKLNGPGKFLVDAYVPGKEEKVFSLPVPRVRLEWGDKPRSVAGQLIWGEQVSEAFRKKVFAIADELKVNPQYLMACMAFETGGTFKSDVRNKKSGAIGLIQFIPGKNDKMLGKTTEQLKVMPEVEQLDYVQMYFRHWMNEKKKPLVSLGDVYACIIWPAGIGNPDDMVYFRLGDPFYEGNSGLDRGKKGYVTKADATVPVQEWLDNGWDHRM